VCSSAKETGVVQVSFIHAGVVVSTQLLPSLKPWHILTFFSGDPHRSSCLQNIAPDLNPGDVVSSGRK
jgi:hypothetical protein